MGCKSTRVNGNKASCGSVPSIIGKESPPQILQSWTFPFCCRYQTRSCFYKMLCWPRGPGAYGPDLWNILSASSLWTVSQQIFSYGVQSDSCWVPPHCFYVSSPAHTLPARYGAKDTSMGCDLCRKQDEGACCRQVLAYLLLIITHP